MGGLSSDLGYVEKSYSDNSHTVPSSYLLPVAFCLPVLLSSYDECGKTLEQVAQRGGRCPIPGNVHGPVGWGSEQPDLVEDVPAHCRGVGLDDL